MKESIKVKVSFQVAVVSLLAATLLTQLCILYRMPSEIPRVGDLDGFNSVGRRRALLQARPVIRIEGEVEADIDEPVRVDVDNVPLPITVVR